MVFLEQAAVLKGHVGMVKGITWDPVGKYVASQVCLKFVNIVLHVYFFLNISS